MELTKVILITSGFSSFVAEICTCEKLVVVGILDCSACERLRSYSDKLHIPYRILSQQDRELACWIKENAPDVISVFKMPFLLKEEIFSLPKFGSLNLHPSLLPHYRGPNPWFWTYYNVEKESGVTVHCIDKGEDTGDIVSQKSFDIPLGAKLEEIKQVALQLGTSLMIDALCNIQSINPTPQQKRSSFRAKNMTNYEDLVDWQHWDVKRLWHLLNGFPDILETNHSYLSLHKKLSSYNYYIGEDYSYLQAGEFVFSDNYYVLSCVNGAVRFIIN